MTTRKHLKRRVRLRAAQTGEPYATALRNIRQQRENRMSSTTPPIENVLAHCSFCGKPDTAVEKLVAGPGVYICNQCVDLSAAVIADADRTTPEESARRRAQNRDRPTTELLALLPALLGSAARVEAEFAGLVGRLRERGTDWQTIADAAGTSVDVVRQRCEAVPWE